MTTPPPSGPLPGQPAVRHWSFEEAVWEQRPEGTRVVYPDGSEAINAPDALAHLLVAEALGGRSLVLRMAAVGDVNDLDWWVLSGERRLARDFAAYCAGKEPTPWLAPLAIAGHELPTMRRLYRHLLGET